MGKIIGSVKRLLSRRSKSADIHDSLDVVEDSPYYPFCWREKDNGEYVVVLHAEEEYKASAFKRRNMHGNAHDWQRLAEEYAKQAMGEDAERIDFDSDDDLFYAYSDDGDLLRRFMTELKLLSEDDSRLATVLDRVSAEDNLL